MLLHQYLKIAELSQAEFGRLIHRTPSAVNRYVQGLRMPPLEELAEIHNATAGLVSADDFFRHMAAKRGIALFGGKPPKGKPTS